MATELRTWLVVLLGIIIGVPIILLPQLIHQNTVPNLAGVNDAEEGITATRNGGIEEVAWGKLPVLVAMAGLGIGVAFATYLLLRWRE